MKVRFYLDLWPGLYPNQYALMATTSPGVKAEGARRLAFDVAIPDEMLYLIDVVSPEVSRPEVVQDHDE